MQQLLADGPVVVEQLGVLARFVEPDDRVGQIEEGDAALADDLQIGGPAEGGRFVPLRRRRSCRRRSGPRRPVPISPVGEKSSVITR